MKTNRTGGLLFHAYSTDIKDGRNLTVSITTDGSIEANVSSPIGNNEKISVSLKPQNSICDEKYHSIMLNKINNHLELVVDGVDDLMELTSINSMPTLQLDKIYVGGFPGKFYIFCYKSLLLKV